MNTPPVPVVFDLFDSPLGPLRVAAGPEGLLSIAMGAQALGPLPAGWVGDPPALRFATDPLRSYLAGNMAALSGLPMQVQGTDFARRARAALASIGPGATCTYAELATLIGQPGAARAVGRAMSTNPLPLVVPCHRVVGVKGRLTGFVGGLARKQWLLTHEAAARAGQSPPPPLHT